MQAEKLQAPFVIRLAGSSKSAGPSSNSLGEVALKATKRFEGFLVPAPTPSVTSQWIARLLSGRWR
jgi:hypothetical protein